MDPAGTNQTTVCPVGGGAQLDIYMCLYMNYIERDNGSDAIRNGSDAIALKCQGMAGNKLKH